MEKIDVAILCGANSKMGSDLKEYSKRKMIEFCKGDEKLLQELKSYLAFTPIPKISLEEVAMFGKSSSAFLTKPGGGTTAEALLGEFPILIHREKNHTWEFGNIEELLESGVTEVSPDQDFYELAKVAVRAKPPNPYDKKEDCIEYSLGVLWEIEKQRRSLQTSS